MKNHYIGSHGRKESTAGTNWRTFYPTVKKTLLDIILYGLAISLANPREERRYFTRSNNFYLPLLRLEGGKVSTQLWVVPGTNFRPL